MTRSECLRELEQQGTAQNRKTYARHGVGENMYGVSFAALKALQKSIRQDDALACELWETGNHDARVLATMIADPAVATTKRLNAWVADCDNPVLAGLLAEYAAKSPQAAGRAVQWKKAKRELTSCTAWCIIGRLAGETNGLDDEFFEQRMQEIEASVHSAPNRAREAMNGALIAIGCRNQSLRKQALAAAKRIGEVYVDHGETSCKTPDAAAYIAKTWTHRRSKAKRAG
jgi:3-methyladenine DNA glycosylase AlkD